MKFQSLLAIVLLIGAVGISSAQNIEQKYATRWNVDPIVRFAIDKNLDINATKCRIDVEPYKDLVLKGRPVGPIHGKPTWQIFVPDIAPGTYKVTHDLRTPLGAEWIEGTLRVPQIARHSGGTKTMKILGAWPQDTHTRIAQDNGVVEFAWDRENLYVRQASGTKGSVSVVIDLLPNTGGKSVFKVTIKGRKAISWKKLAPAGPHIGQVLRYTIVDSGNKSDSRDLLFVGSGTGIHFGASTVGGPNGDDQGPDPAILRALIDMSGLDLKTTGIEWRDVEKTDPGNGESKYDWSKLRGNPDLFNAASTHVHVGLDCPWADKIKDTEPERYKKLAHRFLAAAAKEFAYFGVKHFSLGYNEPEMFFRSDRERFFVKDLDFRSAGIKMGLPDAQVMAGKFSSGDAGLIKQFYYNGFKDNFDILDIHPYNNDPRTGTSMGEVVLSHDTLEELGMGHKRIYLGEGWGPTRNLHQVGRGDYRDPVSEREADFHRQFYQNGYREMITPRMDYSPDWVLGAKYFTLNDNVGGTYWKQAARPVRNAKGEIEYYLIGELRFGDPETLKAFFCNGGLVDFQGKPKGQWFFDFPPALPEVRVLASSAPKYVLVGEEQEVTATITNAENRPITDLVIGLRSQTGKWDGELTAEVIGPVEKPSLAPGETWTTKMKYKVVRSVPGPVRIAVELDYKFDGDTLMAEDIIRTEVRPPVDVYPDKSIITMSPGDPPARVGVSIRNNLREKTEIKTNTVRRSQIETTLSPSTITLASEEEARGMLTISPMKPEPGIRTAFVIKGSDSGVDIITPLMCPRAKSVPVIDGKIADWSADVIKNGGISFGSSIGTGARPADYPFPEPPPVDESAVGKVVPSPEAKSTSAPQFGADAAAMWDDNYLYVSAAVEDKSFVQNYTGMEIWREDSIQIAFDPMDDGAGERTVTASQFAAKTNEEQYSPDDSEYVMALTPVGPQFSRIVGPTGVPTGILNDVKLAIKNENGFTFYEAAIPWSTIAPFQPKPGARFRMDILVNNFENGDRFTLGWADAIANGKYPSRYIPIILGE